MCNTYGSSYVVYTVKHGKMTEFLSKWTKNQNSQF